MPSRLIASHYVAAGGADSAAFRDVETRTRASLGVGGCQVQTLRVERVVGRRG
jgi:hypothetical protein